MRRSAHGESLMVCISEIPEELNEVLPFVQHRDVSRTIAGGNQAELGKSFKDCPGSPYRPTDQQLLVWRVSCENPNGFDEPRNGSGVKERRVEQDDAEVLVKPARAAHVVVTKAGECLETGISIESPSRNAKAFEFLAYARRKDSRG